MYLGSILNEFYNHTL